MFTEIKSFLGSSQAYGLSVFILVSVLSFGLGRMSVVSSVPVTAHSGAVLRTLPVAEEKEVEVVADQTAEPTLVASKSGTKYHYTWCSSAARITEENRVYFTSTTEARAAGYTPAANCPGLE